MDASRRKHKKTDKKTSWVILFAKLQIPKTSNLCFGVKNIHFIFTENQSQIGVTNLAVQSKRSMRFG